MKHESPISEQQVERAILVYAAEVQWSWSAFCQEALYNTFGHLSAGVILWRHGRVGLKNRGFDCDVCADGGSVIVLQALVLLVATVCVSCFVLGRMFHTNQFEVSEAEVVIAIGLNIMRSLTVATKYGFMPTPVYTSLDRCVMTPKQRVEYLLLGGWWRPGKELLYREMEKAAARHDPEFDTRLVVFETKQAKSIALDALRSSLAWFLRMESGRLAADIEEELRYANTSWELTRAHSDRLRQADGEVGGRTKPQVDPEISMASQLQAPVSVSPFSTLSQRANAGIELFRDAFPAGLRAESSDASSQYNPLTAPSALGGTDTKPLGKESIARSLRPTNPVAAVAAAKGQRARAAVARQQQVTEIALCDALRNTESGRTIWKVAMASRHAIPAKLIAWHTVEQCYREEPSAWLSVVCKVVATLFGMLPCVIRVCLHLPAFGSTPLAMATICATMMLGTFNAHTTVMYCCVGALDASRRLAVQLRMSQLIDLKREGVANARMMVQSVQAELDCERRQAETNDPTCSDGRRVSHGHSWERRSTQELSIELQQRAMQRALEFADGGSASVDSTDGETTQASRSTLPNLEMSLDGMTSLPRSRRRASVLRDLATGSVEIDSDEEDSDEESNPHKSISAKRRPGRVDTGLSNALLRVGGRQMAPPARSELLESGVQLSQSAAERFVRDELRTLRLPLLRPGNVESWYQARTVCLDTGRLYEQRITVNGGLYLGFALLNLVLVLVLVFTEAYAVVKLAEEQLIQDLPVADRILLARFAILVTSCLILELLFSFTTLAQVVLGAMSNEEGIIHCDRMVQTEAVAIELRYSPPTVLTLLAAQLAKNTVDRAQNRLKAVGEACNVAFRRIKSSLEVEPMKILGLPASFALVSTIVSAAGSGLVAAISAISSSVPTS